MIDSANIHSLLVQPLLLFASLSILGLAYVLWEYRDGRALGTNRRDDLFSTNDRVFLLGDLLSMIKNQDRALDKFVEDVELRDRSDKAQGKALSYTLPGRRIIDVSSPHMLEYIQKRNAQNYVKGPVPHKINRQLLGQGIFNTDKEAWHSQRKATSKIFTANNFNGVISQSIDSNVNRLLTILNRQADNGTEFDLSDLFFRFTLSSFAEMAFGHDVGALSTDSDEPVPFATAFDYGQSILGRRFANPFWPITERFNGTATKMEDASKIMDDFAYKVIDERERMGRGNFTSSQKKEAADKDLLSLYMAVRDENGQPMNRKALRDALMNLIIAGRDTSAQLFSWVFFRLLRQPELLEPLQNEVREMGEVNYESYKSMVQTLAVLNEGLRLHPSVPRNALTALADDQIPNGPRIEKGDRVLWCDFSMGRSKDLWGEDAREFKPSRWIDEKGELVKETQYKAHFFNGGYRHCLGMNLALFEGVKVLSALVRDFDIAFAPGYLEKTRMSSAEGTPCYTSSLTLPMADPLLVKVSRRSQ